MLGIFDSLSFSFTYEHIFRFKTKRFLNQILYFIYCLFFSLFGFAFLLLASFLICFLTCCLLTSLFACFYLLHCPLTFNFTFMLTCLFTYWPGCLFSFCLLTRLIYLFIYFFTFSLSLFACLFFCLSYWNSKYLFEFLGLSDCCLLIIAAKYTYCV